MKNLCCVGDIRVASVSLTQGFVSPPKMQVFMQPLGPDFPSILELVVLAASLDSLLHPTLP